MLNWKAVVLGAAADFVGTYIGIHLLLLPWLVTLKLQGVADDDLIKTVGHDPLFLAISVTAGWYFDYLGGKISGLIAFKQAPTLTHSQAIWHGLAASVPGVVLALVDTFGSDDPQFPAWFMVACCAVSLVCGSLGGAQARPVQESRGN